jgi:hypothetical protein
MIFVYDVTKCESFGKLSVWVETAFQLASAPTTKVLIGKKADLSAQRTASTLERSDLIF